MTSLHPMPPPESEQAEPAAQIVPADPQPTSALVPPPAQPRPAKRRPSKARFMARRVGALAVLVGLVGVIVVIVNAVAGSSGDSASVVRLPRLSTGAPPPASSTPRSAAPTPPTRPLPHVTGVVATAGPLGAAVTSPTAARPLRVLVTGDSLTGYLGPALLESLPQHRVDGRSITHDSTGLARPDFFDWPAHAREQVATYHPQVVVLMLGGNDGQGMIRADHSVVQPGDPRWDAEYQLRAARLAHAFLDAGVQRLYWISMVDAQSTVTSARYAEIDADDRAVAARTPGVVFLDVRPALDVAGHYSDTVPGVGLTRQEDHIHLNVLGSQYVARLVAPFVAFDWKLH